MFPRGIICATAIGVALLASAFVGTLMLCDECSNVHTADLWDAYSNFTANWFRSRPEPSSWGSASEGDQGKTADKTPTSPKQNDQHLAMTGELRGHIRDTHAEQPKPPADLPRQDGRSQADRARPPNPTQPVRSSPATLATTPAPTAPRISQPVISIPPVKALTAGGKKEPESGEAFLSATCHETIANASEPNLKTARHIRLSKEKSTKKLMCVVYSYHGKHNRVRAESQTWAKRCHRYLVSSDTDDEAISAVNLSHAGNEEYANMWQKTRSTIKYVHERYRNDYDWFFFAGDDIFLVVENLLAYLESDNLTAAIGGNYTYDTPVLIGGLMNGRRPFRIFVFGGSGYVMNRAGLDMFANQVYPACHASDRSSMEDVLITECMRKFNAKIPNTADAKGRNRFARFSPDMYWYTKIARRVGLRCCTEDLISLHYLLPKDIYFFERFLYGGAGQQPCT
jgi:hypothetical protein